MLAKKSLSNLWPMCSKVSSLDDEVVDWVTEALHQGDAARKRFREEAIVRLHVRQRIQN
jgi:hypothetical protein